MTRANDDRIDGWREIAAYLARDERTAKRWEKQRGLPVHRIPGEGRANVYVLQSEVEAWLQKGRQASEPETEEIAGTAEEAEAAPAVEAGPAGEVEAAAESIGGSTAGGEETELAAGLTARPESGSFRPSEHVSLMVSLCGLVLLLAASAIRFFHVERLESILFASESLNPARGSRAAGADADRLYLQGVYLTEQRTPESLAQAKHSFDEAIRRDPEFAPNYGGLARVYLLEREYATRPDREAYEQAKAAAEKALTLDPNLAEAHTALGFIDFFWLWRAADGEREFRRAMDLDPSDALAHHWYGSMLTHQGRYQEAIAQLDQAQHLQPTSAAILASKALAIGFGGEKEKALELLRTMDGTGGSAAMVHRDIAYLSMVAPRDPETYLREGMRFAEIRHDAAGMERLRAETAAFQAHGETAMWASVLGQEQETHPDAEHPTYVMAKAEASLGHEDAAIDTLARLATQRDGLLMGMVTEPAFDRLRKDAKFVRIAERVGLLYPAVATR